MNFQKSRLKNKEEPAPSGAATAKAKSPTGKKSPSKAKKPTGPLSEIGKQSQLKKKEEEDDEKFIGKNPFLSFSF